MEEYKIFLDSIREINDYWVKVAESRLLKDDDTPFPSWKKQYALLRSIINTEENIKAYKDAINDILEGFIHTILVMFDNGDALADHFIIDIINYDTQKSIKGDIALHEEYEYTLNDVE